MHKISYEDDRNWFKPEDLKETEIQIFECIQAKKLKNNMDIKKQRSHENLIMDEVEYDILIRSVHSELQAIKRFLPVSLAFFLTNETGTIIELISPNEEMLSEIDKSGLYIGANVSRTVAGLNAVSLSMETKGVTVVSGEEHTLKMFRSWNCVCVPIRINRIIYGYLDASFNYKFDVRFAVPLVVKLAMNVTANWECNSPFLQRESLLNRFNKYKLSPREKEVAYYWYRKKGAFHISNKLGVTEGTIRNFVKSIYSKMNVGDRDEFIAKL